MAGDDYLPLHCWEYSFNALGLAGGGVGTSRLAVFRRVIVIFVMVASVTNIFKTGAKAEGAALVLSAIWVTVVSPTLG